MDTEVKRSLKLWHGIVALIVSAVLIFIAAPYIFGSAWNLGKPVGRMAACCSLYRGDPVRKGGCARHISAEKRPGLSIPSVL